MSANKDVSSSKVESFYKDVRRIMERHLSHSQDIMLEMSGDSVSLSNVVSALAAEPRDFSFLCHLLKFQFDWGVHPAPEWFDHFIDQYYQMPQSGSTLWAERGVYGVLGLKKKGRLLDLCCGDGFNSRHFYSPFVNEIVAVDFDEEAIQHAIKFNSKPNITHVLNDIRVQMPDGIFDNIIWDAAIEHFTEIEIKSIMSKIKDMLADDGILSGYTIVESDDGVKQLHQHEREFRSKQDLADFIVPHYKNVRVFETFHPNRHNLYFWASDSALPFDDAWPGSLHIVR